MVFDVTIQAGTLEELVSRVTDVSLGGMQLTLPEATASPVAEILAV